MLKIEITNDEIDLFHEKKLLYEMCNLKKIKKEENKKNERNTN